MSDQNDKLGEPEGIPLTEAKLGFEVHELVMCPACGKPNGPDRGSCLYCGEALARTERNAGAGKLQLRELEDWEPGVNVITVPTAEIAPNIDTAAGVLGMSVEVLAEILEKRTHMPLARVENRAVADEVSTNFKELGIDVRAIDDSEIDAERMPIRVRAVEAHGQNVTFIDFNTGEKYPVEVSDIVLVVSGNIFESSREEVTRRKRGATKVLDEFESARDQRVLDIYTSQNNVGFRILTNGFDFSVLGDEKDLFAAKNIIRLQSYFSTLFPGAVIADEYDSLRDLLDIVWPDAISKDMHGLQIRGYGKREFGATYTSSNLVQFTRYSRMRRLML